MSPWQLNAFRNQLSAAHCRPHIYNRSTQPCIQSSTSFGWDKGGNITSAGWQVTLCDPMWHVSSRCGVATLRTAIHLFNSKGSRIRVGLRYMRIFQTNRIRRTGGGRSRPKSLSVVDKVLVRKVFLRFWPCESSSCPCPYSWRLHSRPCTCQWSLITRSHGSVSVL